MLGNLLAADHAVYENRSYGVSGGLESLVLRPSAGREESGSDG
jgi:hypothetical protein